MNDCPKHPSGRAWNRFVQNRPAVVALSLLVALLLLTLLGSLLWPYAPNSTSGDPFSPPSSSHWFGTDIHGRDLLARVLVGLRISLLIGIIGAGVSVLIGVAWGMIAAYAGGRTDTILMRTVDLLYALPNIIFVMLVIGLTEAFVIQAMRNTVPSLVPHARMILLFVCLGAVSWLNMARIVRGQILSLRSRPFILASRLLGAGPRFILSRHLLPNVFGVVIIYATLTIPSVILYESFLSFLGMGIRPPDASLGTLIEDGARQLNPIRIHWWLLAFPCGFLTLALLALQFVGDGLRDALEPRSDH